MSKEYVAAYYIGRFQMPHLGHSLNIDHGLKVADKVVILVGSANKSIDEKNSFTFEQRKHMLKLMYPQNNVYIEPLNDYYNDNQWFAQVQAVASKYASEYDSCCILGQYSDESSWYLNKFPQWEKEFTKNRIPVHATEIRNHMYETGEVLKEHLHPEVAKWLEEEFITPLDKWTDKQTQFQKIVGSYRFHKDHNEKIAKAAKIIGHPIQFLTCDATVTCCGHVLVIKRARHPGMGLYALPGGYLKSNEYWVTGAIRELHEESGISVDKPELAKHIVAYKHFDNPTRSLRGRILTMNYHIDLPYTRLPNVKANDDAEENSAEWMPFNTVAKNEHLFFEDHAQMIQYFTSKSEKESNKF